MLIELFENRLLFSLGNEYKQYLLLQLDHLHRLINPYIVFHLEIIKMKMSLVKIIASK